MAYDSARDHVVLFRGEAPAQLYLGDTWELVDNQPKP
jgi:hypothetical protein